MADLTGKRFNKLVVIERVEHRVRSTWKCICDCGNYTEVLSFNLTSGKVKSCGCLRSPDLTGRKFGRLLVLRRVTEKLYGKPAWWCRCDCGAEKLIGTNALTVGKTVSCGCYNRENAGRLRRTHGLSRTAWYKRWAQRHRKRDGLGWTEDMDILLFTIQPVCVICGSKEDLTVDHVRPFSKGFGLCPGNVVVLCRPCNCKKADKDLEELPDNWRGVLQEEASNFSRLWEQKG